MPPHNVDTNILLRNIEPNHPQYPVTNRAIAHFRANKVRLYVLPQNIREFWNTCTRPVDRNGLGKTIAEANTAVADIEVNFEILEESLTTYQEWRRLVFQHQVSGVQVHDANLVAGMNVHGITHLLTFNGKDFARYTNVVAVDPSTV